MEKKMKLKIVILSICMTLSTAAAFAHGGEEHVTGTVTSVTDKAITVKTTKAPVTVNVASTTTFIKSKAAAKVSDLKVGDRVVIHAKEGLGEKLVADTVEFGATPQTSAKPAPAAASKPAPSSAAPAQQQKTLTGVVTDAACGATHKMPNMAPADCARTCAKQGGYALVVGNDVYTLKGHEADLDKYAAQTVTVTGAVNGKDVTVASVMPAKKAA
jgi:hypothetical protein